MDTEQKTEVKNSIGRVVFIGISILLQVLWIVLMVIKLNEYSTYISLFSSILALLLALDIYGKNMNAAMKMPWIMLILVFPVLGVCLYFLIGSSDITKRMKQHFEQIDGELEGKLCQNGDIFNKLENENIGIANQAYYIWKYGKFPIYQNTDIEFYPEAIDGLKAQIEAIKQAEEFIFLEYHAIEDARSFGEMKELLTEKVKQGVEVRIIYDDVGSVGFINTDFIKRMEAEGIQCRVFNPVIPFLNIFMNNRDHRKITVVDGKVGFTGGYNLADEYFNMVNPYGRWKDTGVKIIGDGVRSLTVMFLEMWNAIRKTDTDYEKYLPFIPYKSVEQGYIQPYADCPLDQEHVGENVYLNIIKNAKHYIYFTTPYLIITDEMNRELGLAAKRGVDVRVITPGIPDKKAIYKVTRSYYAGLVRRGVRIYEYTPGFCHAKQCVCDDEAATVGTINLDYRSLYYHFENGVFLYNCNAVGEIKKDFDHTLLECREVTKEYETQGTFFKRFKQNILRLFAPLL